MDEYFTFYREMISIRGLSGHTMKSYCTYIRAWLIYLRHILGERLDEASWQDMRDFIRTVQLERKLADRTVNGIIAQLRFFTMYVLHKPWDPTQLPNRKFDAYLPCVPSQEAPLYFIDSMPDLKQKAMVALLYSSGLRIGELCRLRFEDVSRKNMRIHVTHGKNRHDRYAPLSDYVLEILTEYWFAYGKPRGWLFPKQHDPDRPIDTFFLSRHIHEHEDRLGWPRRITCHSFRHAFGTHLYENGTDLLTVQAMLGHRTITSTTLYVHLAAPALSKVTNPLDRLKGAARD